MEGKYAGVLARIKDTGELDADTEKQLKDAIDEFKKVFVWEE